MKKFFLVITLITLYSCSSTQDKKSESYDLVINESISNWEEIEKDLADHAYKNSKTQSLLIINSQCRKYNNTKLKNMYFDLFPSTGDTRVISEEYLKLHNRDALKVSSVTSADGVERFLTVVLFKRNRCTYDFILISENKTYLDADTSTVINIIKGISFND